MTEKTVRINKVLRELNISLDRAVEFLSGKGFEVEHSPNAKISETEYQALIDEFQIDRQKKEASLEISEEKRKEKEALRLKQEKEEQEREAALLRKQKESETIKAKSQIAGLKQVGKIDLDAPKAKAEPVKAAADTEEKGTPVKPETPQPEKAPPVEQKIEDKVVAEKAPARPTEEESDEVQTIETQYTRLSGPKKTGETIDLSKFEKPKKKKEEKKKDEPKKRFHSFSLRPKIAQTPTQTHQQKR